MYDKVMTSKGLMVQVPVKDFEEFIIASALLAALYVAGVDNWEGFDYAKGLLEASE